MAQIVVYGVDSALRPRDIEVTITETPRANWSIRGLLAHELDLPYRVDLA